MTDVVDSNHDRTSRSSKVVRHEIEFLVQIQFVGAAQLWNLRIRPLFQNASHLIQDLNERQIVLGSLFVFVEHIEQRRRTSTAGFARWIGQLKVAARSKQVLTFNL